MLYLSECVAFKLRQKDLNKWDFPTPFGPLSMICWLFSLISFNIWSNVSCLAFEWNKRIWLFVSTKKRFFWSGFKEISSDGALMNEPGNELVFSSFFNSQEKERGLFLKSLHIFIVLWIASSFSVWHTLSYYKNSV